MAKPRSNPVFEGTGVPNLAAFNGGFETPRMTIATDRQSGVAELEKAKIHQEIEFTHSPVQSEGVAALRDSMNSQESRNLLEGQPVLG
jgi:hypothetical protein